MQDERKRDMKLDDRLQCLPDGTFADPLLETAFKASFFRTSFWFHLAAIFTLFWPAMVKMVQVNLVIFGHWSGGFGPWSMAMLPVVLLGRVWLHKLTDHTMAQRIGVQVFVLYMMFIYVPDIASIVAGVNDPALLVESVDDPVLAASMSVVSLVIGLCQGTLALPRTFHASLVLMYTVDILLNAMVLPKDHAPESLSLATTLLAIVFGICSTRVYERSRRTNYVSEEMRLRAQEQLASYLFHELRNHQSAQLGVLEIVAEHVERAPHEPFPAHDITLLAEARVHAWQGGRVISNMLDFAKLRAGKLELTADPFDLIELLEECVLLVRHVQRQKPDLLVYVRAEVGDAPMKLQGPVTLLKQVIVNLLTNAIKYTSTGHVLLRATLPDDGVAPPIVIAIEDTGSGIAPDKLTTIFEPFEQGYQPGTGIGLPLCKDVLETMGSTLTVSQPPSGGSVFSFMLKCGVAPTTPPTTLDASRSSLCQAASPRGRAIRVLIADNLRLNRVMLGRKVKELAPHAIIREESDGEAALATLSSACPEEPFDIAFLDEYYDLSDGLKGTDVTRQYRNVEASRNALDARTARRLLIIGCSGSIGDEGYNETAYAAGQDLVFAKPIPSAAQMAKAINEAQSNLLV